MMKSPTDLSAFYVPLPSETVEFVKPCILTHKKTYTACPLPPQGSVIDNKITPYWSSH